MLAATNCLRMEADNRPGTFRFDTLLSGPPRKIGVARYEIHAAGLEDGPGLLPEALGRQRGQPTTAGLNQLLDFRKRASIRFVDEACSGA